MYFTCIWVDLWWVLYFNDFFFRLSLRVSAFGLRESSLSSYWIEIYWDGGWISNTSWIVSLQMKNSFLPHPTIDAIFFCKGICKESPYDFGEDIPTWVQQLCLNPLLEHFRNEGVYKGLHIDNLFHDDQGLLVEIIVGHVCLNPSEVFWFRARTLWSFLCGRVLSRRHL